MSTDPNWSEDDYAIILKKRTKGVFDGDKAFQIFRGLTSHQSCLSLHPEFISYIITMFRFLISSKTPVVSESFLNTVKLHLTTYPLFDPERKKDRWKEEFGDLSLFGALKQVREGRLKTMAEDDALKFIDSYVYKKLGLQEGASLSKVIRKLLYLYFDVVKSELNVFPELLLYNFQGSLLTFPHTDDQGQRVMRPYATLAQAEALLYDCVSPQEVDRTFVFSIHPADCITMSHGNSWSSCHSFRNNGGYSMGAYQFGASSAALICYIPVSQGGETHLCLVDKVMRQLVFVSDEVNAFIQNIFYPKEENPEVWGVFVREYLMNLIGVAKFATNPWIYIPEEKAFNIPITYNLFKNPHASVPGAEATQVFEVRGIQKESFSLEQVYYRLAFHNLSHSEQALNDNALLHEGVYYPFAKPRGAGGIPSGTYYFDPNKKHFMYDPGPESRYRKKVLAYIDREGYVGYQDYAGKSIRFRYLKGEKKINFRLCPKEMENITCISTPIFSTGPRFSSSSRCGFCGTTTNVLDMGPLGTVCESCQTTRFFTCPICQEQLLRDQLGIPVGVSGTLYCEPCITSTEDEWKTCVYTGRLAHLPYSFLYKGERYYLTRANVEDTNVSLIDAYAGWCDYCGESHYKTEMYRYRCFNHIREENNYTVSDLKVLMKQRVLYIRFRGKEEVEACDRSPFGPINKAVLDPLLRLFDLFGLGIDTSGRFYLVPVSSRMPFVYFAQIIFDQDNYFDFKTGRPLGCASPVLSMNGEAFNE